MNWILQILIGVGLLLWLGNTTNSNPVSIADPADVTDNNISFYDYYHHSPSYGGRRRLANPNPNSISTFKHNLFSKFRNPQRKKEDLTGEFMEEGGLSMGGGKLSCEACGDECTRLCLTRHFRACCFHFARKKKASKTASVTVLLVPSKGIEPKSSSLFDSESGRESQSDGRSIFRNNNKNKGKDTRSGEWQQSPKDGLAEDPTETGIFYPVYRNLVSK